MSNKNKKYGNHGKLFSAFPTSLNDICYHDMTDNETNEFLQKLLYLGVLEAYFDIEDNENHSCTLFFEIGKNTNLKDLMILIAKQRPHEFSEESENCFRMWFD